MAQKHSSIKIDKIHNNRYYCLSFLKKTLFTTKGGILMQEIFIVLCIIAALVASTVAVHLPPPIIMASQIFAGLCTVWWVVQRRKWHRDLIMNTPCRQCGEQNVYIKIHRIRGGVYHTYKCFSCNHIN